MKKMLSLSSLLYASLFLSSLTVSTAFADPAGKLEIGVETSELRFFRQINGVLTVSTYSVGTARLGKSTERLPYGKIFRIGRLILLPAYSPTEETRREYSKRHNRSMKKFFLPGERGNALGLLKLYFYNENGSISTLGMHTSDNPSSIKKKRVSHGCVRLFDNDAKEIAIIFLTRTGYTLKEATEIIQQAEETKKLLATGKLKSSWNLSKIITISDGPEVVYLRK